MNAYKEAIIEAMAWLGAQEDTVFIGQTVRDKGSYMHGSLEKVPQSKLIEFPVAEEMQLGASLGLALEGYCVVSLYPRFDFLLLALNQLVNHVDKIPEMSEQKMKPRIIIRTSVGPKEPLDGGLQHTGNYIEEIRGMCRNVKVMDLMRCQPEEILEAYQVAYHNAGSALVVGQVVSPDAPGYLFVENGGRY